MTYKSVYEDADRGHYDYSFAPIPGVTHHPVRGPNVDRSRPYVVCLGAAQTMGRFVDRPVPALLEEKLGIPVQNLGIGGIGPSEFLADGYLEFLNSAELVVVQVLSGRSESNSLFDNEISGGLTGIRLSDGSKMRFEEFLQEIIERGDHETLDRVIRETRDNWIRNTNRLLDAIHTKKILFYFSRRAPRYRPDYSSLFGTLSHYPQLIDDVVLRSVQESADAYVEFGESPGMPQQLWRSEREVIGARLTDGMLYNDYYPSPEMHRQAADRLLPVVRHLLFAKS